MTNNEGTMLSTNILFRKRFHQKGRTFSLNLLTNFNNSTGDGSMQSVTNFYNTAGSLFRIDSLIRKNNHPANLNGFNVRAVYTEPIFKKSLLEFSVGRNYAKNTSSRTTYDYNQYNGKFDLINNLLTNDFENTYGYTTAGLHLRKQTKKYNYAVGANWQRAELEGNVKAAVRIPLSENPLAIFCLMEDFNIIFHVIKIYRLITAPAQTSLQLFNYSLFA